MTTKTLIKGSNNVVTVTLTEDGSAIGGAWTELDIYIGTDAFNIHRTSNGNGVALAAGVLTINPGQLTEDLSTLPSGLHRAYVRIKTSTNAQGAYWGADDTPGQLHFDVSDPPG